jgi:hypothetical protein
MEHVNICDYEVTTMCSDDELQKEFWSYIRGSTLHIEVFHFGATSEVSGGSAKLLSLLYAIGTFFSYCIFQKAVEGVVWQFGRSE